MRGALIDEEGSHNRDNDEIQMKIPNKVEYVFARFSFTKKNFHGTLI